MALSLQRPAGISLRHRHRIVAPPATAKHDVDHSRPWSPRHARKHYDIGKSLTRGQLHPLSTLNPVGACQTGSPQQPYPYDFTAREVVEGTGAGLGVSNVAARIVTVPAQSQGLHHYKATHDLRGAQTTRY